MESEIKKLRELGIIRNNSSSYISPCFPIQKKNGSIRLVIDYRRLNKMIKPESYLITKIKEKLMNMRGSSWFTTLDLASSNYQLEVWPKHRKYT